jgi:hypothetical protein
MHTTPLRTALLANALFSALSGLTCIMFSSSVAALIGLGAPIIYQIIGVGLVGFAGFVAWTGTRQPISAFLAALISMADFLWVVGTLLVLVLAAGALHPAGIASLIAIAAIVLFFGIRQLQGIGKLYALPGKPTTHKLCVAVDTPAPADNMWAVIADLGSIHAYSPNLTRVILRDDAQPGVDAVRQCTDVSGKTWGEHCTRYDPDARSVAFQFLADEPGFPYPFTTMVGGWDIVPKEDGSTVTIWFEVTPRYTLLHPLILALMSRNIARSFGEIVARMTAAARGEEVPTHISLEQHGIRSVLLACS